MEIPETVYKTLESVENGAELIAEIKKFKSSVNDEAKSLRQQRNYALETLGIDKESINKENYLESLQKKREEMEFSLKEAQNKAKEAETKGMTESQKLQKQIEELSKKFSESQKSIEEKERQIEVSNRNRSIDSELKKANVAPQFIDDLSVAIQSRLTMTDSGWKYNHNGELKSLSDGVKAHLEGKESLIKIEQRQGANSNPGHASGVTTEEEKRRKRWQRIKSNGLPWSN